MKVLLFLVDDHEYGFWKRGDWPQATWPSDWDIHCIAWEALPDRVGEPVNDLANAISNIVTGSSAEKFCVISDSRFGSRHGGGRLLEELLRRWDGRLLRGVVYSFDAQMPTGLPADQFLKFVTGSDGDDSAAILLFLEKGQTPPAVVESVASKLLSMAIHSLEDIAYPMRLDAETLAHEPGKMDEIHEDYFQNVSGYLAAQGSDSFGEGQEGGLEGRIIKALTREVNGSSARIAVACFHPDESLRNDWSSSCPPECHRLNEVLQKVRNTAASAGLRDQHSLTEALRAVIVRIDEIISRLRDALTAIRKEVRS